MEKNRKFRRFGVFVLFLLNQSLFRLCFSLNNEALALLKIKERVVSDPYGALKSWGNDAGVTDACSWFGVGCSDGKVVALDLKDLCLGGTLAPEMKNLIHIKSIVLRNNSFTGIIPEGIGELKELEVLDFGYNDFRGPVPSDLGNSHSLAILLLDSNELLGILSPEIQLRKILSQVQVDKNLLSGAAKASYDDKRCITRNVANAENAVHGRRLEQTDNLRENLAPPSPRASMPFFFDPWPPVLPSPPEANVTAPAPLNEPSAPSPSPLSPTEPIATSPSVNGPLSSPSPSPAPIPSLNVPQRLNSSSKSNHGKIIGGAIGGTLFIVVALVGLFIWKTSEATIKPWATGLSGQLQKAFVTGVPSLKRSELEAGCEDFSNVIGNSPIGTLYKGTLSSGVEIAVASVAVTSAKDWSKNLELQYRKKIEILSKVNHKNFMNLIGYCAEQEPFTRMMVFEYAPNGTLFEHLHIKESEHLDWGMRLRIATGMAYCLEHMHQLNPPMAHPNLNSSAVTLTEDYAAKISDFSFSTEIIATDIEAYGKNAPDRPLARTESNVYDFGVLLFELVTGRLPYSVDGDSLEDWASDYLSGSQPLRDMVDPTLDSFEEEKLERIGDVIKACVHPIPAERPSMKEITARLREITGITPDAAIPRLSPLWWAELEILSTEAS